MTVSEVSRKSFTREEAERTLPLVRLIVRDIVDLHGDLQSRRERLEDLVGGRRRKSRREDDPYAEEIRQMQSELAADVQTYRDLVTELESLGVQVSDAETGSVTFPARDGSQIRWRIGDEHVQTEQRDNTLNLYSPPSPSVDTDDLASEAH
jgi:hypothetical protein